jgi:hypothetical protein
VNSIYAKKTMMPNVNQIIHKNQDENGIDPKQGGVKEIQARGTSGWQWH